MSSIAIVSTLTLDSAKFAERAETSIKLENKKLTRLNKKFEKNFTPFFGDLPSPSNSHDAVITRLASIYEDPNYGPGWFHGSAKLLKNLLVVYKVLKNNPTSDMFFLEKGAETGIHIHFNSATRRREVVIPVGHAGIDPVRIDIGKFRSWYKKKRMAAISARNKAQEELWELEIKVAQAELDRAKACLEQCERELAMKNALLKAYMEMEDIIRIANLNNSLERAVSKPKEDLLALNEAIDKLKADERMYEKKIFLEKILEALAIAIKKYNNIRDICSSFIDQLKLL